MTLWMPIQLYRSVDIRQPEEVDRIHADVEHPRDLAVPRLHPGRRAAAARHHHDPLHRPRHGHGARHLARLRVGRVRHHEAPAARPAARQTRQRQVREAGR